MAKFKVGDVLDNTGYRYSFFRNGGYVVYVNSNGRLSIEDDDGTTFHISGTPGDEAWAEGCFTARPSRPDPLDYLKTAIRAFVGATSADAWAKQAVLIDMAKDVYGLDTVFVPATADFVTVTQ